jgi:hypothetical protein
MEPYPMRRARGASSLAAATVDLLDEFNVPIPTPAVRILLNDRGREVTAEHLSRLAAYERQDFLRTRLPPRLCSAVDPDANLISPRWWARGDWRLQRRILTPDAKPIWLAVLTARLCHALSARDSVPSEAVTTLALGTVAQLLPEHRDFSLPLAPAEWSRLRTEVLNTHPAATHSLDSPTRAQHTAETALKAAGTSAVDLYFGRSAPPRP